MMYYTLVAPLNLDIQVQLPPSKSISNRVLIINKLADNQALPDNISDCDDTYVMKRALSHSSDITDIMAAGTAMRFLTAYYSVSQERTILTGTPRMLCRPIRVLVDALRELGADITYMREEGFPPLRIEGKPLKGGKVALEGNVSSQFTSALLMIGPVMQQGLQIELKGNIVSRPYIDMTLKLMNAFGARAEWTGSHTLNVAHKPYDKRSFLVENDWSAASYWYEIVALSTDKNATVSLPGLFCESTQGDARVQDIFRLLGVDTTYENNRFVLKKGHTSQTQLELDLEDQPDLAQTIVVTCAMQGRPFKISGLQSLKIKETDRLKALQTELAKLGIPLKASGSSLAWNGKKHQPHTDIAIDTYDDHRMAMAFAPCSFNFPQLHINNPQVVSKSYPAYWQDLQAVGFTIGNL